jgi:hypothetical protein
MTVPPEPTSPATSTTPPETGSVNALTAVNSAPPDNPVQLVNDILKALETPGTSAQTLVTYAGEAVATAGFIIGAFDHQLGLAISTVPQATLLAAATVVTGALAFIRLFAKSKKQMAAAQLAASVHNDQVSRQMSLAHAVSSQGTVLLSASRA